MDISKSIAGRLRLDNPWWESGMVSKAVASSKPRAHLDAFHRLIGGTEPGRAVMLSGPSRSGRTYMLLHAVQRLLDAGADPRTICHIGLENPAYTGISPADLISMYRKESGLSTLKGCTLVLDDAHSLPRWQSVIADFAAAHPELRVVCSSALAATLEDFVQYRLPALQFFEYLELSGRSQLVKSSQAGVFDAPDIEALNAEFIAYMNSGGFPEAIGQPEERAAHLKSIPRIPSMPGIDNARELFRLLGLIALGSSGEMTLEGLSEAMGAAKNTVKKYLDFLESAMLISRLQRVDLDARPFERANFFRPYVCHPSLRAAIWGPAGADDAAIGSMVRTAVIAQIMHSRAFQSSFYYARWPKGTVDMLYMRGGRPVSCTEIRWSDTTPENPPALSFIERNGIKTPLVVTTITRKGVKEGINLYPASLYCYQLGWNITRKA